MMVVDSTMKKEILIHFSSLVIFLLLISFMRGWLNLSYWFLWLGGVVGTILPDLDHIIYAYFLKPQELTSQRVAFLNQKRSLVKSLELLANTRYERSSLIFHTISFQILFLVLAFYVSVSTASIFGTGLVLGFCLHLLIDQLVDYTKVGTIDTWFRASPIYLDQKQSKAYWITVFVIVVILGLFF